MLITTLLILDRAEWSAAEDRLMRYVSPDRKARIGVLEITACFRGVPQRFLCS